MNKNIYLIRIFILITFLLLFVAMGCSRYQDEPTYNSGVILVTDSRVNLFDLSTGKTHQLSEDKFFFSRVFVSTGRHDTLYLVGLGPDFALGESYSWESSTKTSRPVYRYSYRTGRVEVVKAVNDSSFGCTSMKYDERNDIIYYMGKYSGVEGLFVLNPDFSLKDDLTWLIEQSSDNSCGGDWWRHGRNIETICILENNELMVGARGCVWSISLVDSTITKLHETRYLLGSSNDHQNYITVAPRDDNATIYITNSITGSTSSFQTDEKFVLPFCISPTGDAFAYGRVTGFLDDGISLTFISELGERKYNSSLGMGRSFGSGMIWFDKEISEFHKIVQ